MKARNKRVGVFLSVAMTMLAKASLRNARERRILRSKAQGRKASHSILIVILLVGAAFITFLSAVPPSAKATTLYVGGSGPGNYASIQAAVDAACLGDTVFVFNGTCNEYVVIGKALAPIDERVLSFASTGADRSCLPAERVLANWT